ncbi:TetR/AcrR family transcriptional regulator [Oceanobacillus kimchii]|uniref:TetR/AcrR family transcriptional regulator n=1 Tax=Oceanobacillus kimchii TaxID=746691 RepID=UPI000985ABF0|nr:TetR/AcrR family transcriptional regulator [Oceanobacillus kimchii]
MKKEIFNAALSAFANNGYEGTSLAQIADKVGIKKPSIYAHYKSKQDLFLTVIRQSLEREKQHIVSYFIEVKNKPLEFQLRTFFDWLCLKIKKDSHVAFIFRMTYFPPAQLEKEVAILVAPFLKDMEKLLNRLLRNHPYFKTVSFKGEIETISIAYITIVDGCVLELFFTGEKEFQRRVNAVWPIFWRGFRGGNQHE